MTNGNLQVLADEIVALAQARGAHTSEAYITRSETLSLRSPDHTVDWVKRTTTLGLGLRIQQADRIGYAYTSDLSDAGKSLVVEQALANTRYAHPDPTAVIPAAAAPAPVADLVDPGYRLTPLEQKLAVPQRVAAAARAASPYPVHILRNYFGEEQTSIALTNSHGVRVSYTTTFVYAWIELAVEHDGARQTGHAFCYGRSLPDLDSERIGRQAALQACSLVGARPIVTEQVPIILTSQAMATIIAQLAPMFSAEAVQKGRSLLRGQYGEQVAAPSVSLIDDATLPGGLMCRPNDAEGVPSRRNILVDHGIFSSVLHNATTAYREGTESTGNARRHSYRAMPGVGPTNFLLQPGDQPLAALQRSAWRGFQVLDLGGLRSTNPITGHFAASARGFWLEHGALSYPVAEVTITGEYLPLLQTIAGVGDDFMFYPGKLVVGSPSVLVPDVMVSGL